MRVAVLALLSSLVASACAYNVTSPNITTVWKASDAEQYIAWTRVDSDQARFDIVLMQPNGNDASIPVHLMDSVDGTSLSTTVKAPSGQWPTGSGFQVNLVSDKSDNLGGILAQSPRFSIVNGNNPSSNSVSSSGGLTASPANAVPSGTSSGVPSNTQSQDASSSPSASGTASTNSNSATTAKINTGIAAVLLLLTCIAV